MKKYVSLICALALTLLLCGCNSSDYKKATSLYEKEDYMAARELFVALGDYEDSAAMVKECDYNYAIGLLEDEKYEEALAIFDELGDHRESDDYAVDARWGLLYEYIRENGEKKEEIKCRAISQGNVDGKADNVMFLGVKDPDNIVFYSEFKQTGVSRLLTVNVEKGERDAKWQGTFATKISIGAATVEMAQTAGGTVDIHTCDAATELQIEDFYSYTKDIYGKVTTSTNAKEEFMSGGNNAAFKDIMNTIPEMLADTGLPITMKDLGFDAVG